MFLKNAEPRRIFQPVSISLRLTLLYAATSFSLLALSGLYLYGALAHDLKMDDQLFLKGQMHFFKQVLHDRPKQFEELKEKIHLENSVGGIPRYFVRILNDQREVLVESSKMPVPSSEFSKLNEGSAYAENDFQENWKGKDYLLSSEWVESGSPEKKLLIELVADVTADEKILRVYRRKLTLILLGGVLLASLAGVWITHRGLLPLRQMADSTKKISADQLHQRVLQKNWPHELKDLAAAFDDMLRRLEKSFAQISQFSADLAHELRTPINNLMGQTEVLLTKERPLEEFKQIAESNLEEYKKLSRLIDDMLFLSRAENSSTPLNKYLFDPMKEIETVKEFYDAFAEEKGLRVLCEGSGSILGDPLLFKRALANLISNAVKYTSRNGTIMVRVTKKSASAATVTVEDTGSGISTENLPHIFDRFFRADQSRSHDPGGTGLGLSIVKSIMELHGGSVEVQSRPGLGTAMTLIFPG